VARSDGHATSSPARAAAGAAPVEEEQLTSPETMPAAGRMSGEAVQQASGAARASAAEEEMPRIAVTRRRAILFAAFVVVALALLYVVLPQLGSVKHSLDRLNDGDAWWFGVALVLELLSIASYIAIFKGVHVPPDSPIGVRESYLIMMAGLAATRLFAAGGAGGVAVTAWALRRSGMGRREVAQRMIAFLVLVYGVYMVAMIVCGIGLYLGLFGGAYGFAITIVPAIFGVAVIGVFLGIAVVPEDLERRPRWVGAGHERASLWIRRLAAGPASLSSGVHYAWGLLRHPEWALLGTIGWWGFNIGVFYASFRAFGEPPPVAVLVQAYFVGMLANLLPIPGGIGGVEGGMIGALAAFGVSVGLAVPAVLTYRLFAFWLPSIPGAIAYFQLRRTVSHWDASLGEGQPVARSLPGSVPAYPGAGE
jgi:putative heme transporter